MTQSNLNFVIGNKKRTDNIKKGWGEERVRTIVFEAAMDLRG